MDLTDSLKALFIDTATTFKGSARRIFMAATDHPAWLYGRRTPGCANHQHQARRLGLLAQEGRHPVVELGATPYQTGVKLSTEAMEAVEPRLTRLPTLTKWFVDISDSPAHQRRG